MSEAVIVLDGDDTLWQTERLYENALAEIAEWVRAQGLDDRAWLSAQRAYDLKNVTTMGLSRRRFPLSCVQAYEQIAKAEQKRIIAASARTIQNMAKSVFSATALTPPSTVEAIRRAAEVAPLVLLTSGDTLIQERRIEDSGLAKHFIGIWIVPHKDQTSFANILKEFAADPKRSWSVGNSIPSDINPALRAGMNAVWIPADVWSYERRETHYEPGTLLHAVSLPKAISAVLSKTRNM
jgi:putative hydrolase of the HAD superfamily